MSSIPDAVISSTISWIAGVSTTGSSSLGITREAGSMRVPKPAATITALRTFIVFPGWRRLAGDSLLLARFLVGLASDTERGHGPRLEPLDSYIAAAFLA